MRLRLVSVVGESPWSGERSVDDDVSVLSRQELISTGRADSEFAVTVMPPNQNNLASH